MKANEAELKILIALLMRGGSVRAGTEWWAMRREVDPEGSSTDFINKRFIQDVDDEGVWRITEAGKKAVEEASCPKS